MACLGGILVLLAAPLLIGYFVGGRKSAMWGNLGALMFLVGMVIVVVGLATQR